MTYLITQLLGYALLAALCWIRFIHRESDRVERDKNNYWARCRNLETENDNHAYRVLALETQQRLDSDRLKELSETVARQRLELRRKHRRVI